MKSRSAIIAIVVVALAGFGAWHFLVSPPRQEAADVQAQIDTQQAALTTAQTTLAAAEGAKARYRAAYTEVLRLGKAVPEDDDLQSLLVQLSATARASKVRFVSLERGNAPTGAVPTGTGQTTTAPLPPGATVGASGFPTVPLKLTFSGDYFQLTGFLRRLQAYVKTGKTIRVKGRLLTLDGVSLTAPTPGSRKLDAVVSATAYLVSPVEGATAGATAASPGAAAPSGAVSTVPTPATGSNG